MDVPQNLYIVPCNFEGTMHQSGICSMHILFLEKSHELSTHIKDSFHCFIQLQRQNDSYVYFLPGECPWSIMRAGATAASSSAALLVEMPGAETPSLGLFVAVFVRAEAPPLFAIELLAYTAWIRYNITLFVLVRCGRL